MASLLAGLWWGRPRLRDGHGVLNHNPLRHAHARLLLDSTLQLENDQRDGILHVHLLFRLRRRFTRLRIWRVQVSDLENTSHLDRTNNATWCSCGKNNASLEEEDGDPNFSARNEGIAKWTTRTTLRGRNLPISCWDATQGNNRTCGANLTNHHSEEFFRLLAIAETFSHFEKNKLSFCWSVEDKTVRWFYVDHPSPDKFSYILQYRYNRNDLIAVATQKQFILPSFDWRENWAILVI